MSIQSSMEAGRKTLLTENSMPPEPYLLRLYLQSVVEESLHSRQSFWFRTNQFDAFFNLKKASETNDTNNNPPT